MRLALEAIDGYLGRVIDDWSNHVTTVWSGRSRSSRRSTSP
jgi:hypothetical protein